LLVIVVIHIGILYRLDFFPYPELFNYPYLVEKGLLPYKEIVDQHFPGLFFFPINFSDLGLVNIFGARLWQFGIVGITHVIVYLIASEYMDLQGKRSYLANVLYLTVHPFLGGNILWIDNVILLLILPCSLFLYKWDRSRKPIYLFYSGLLLGVALVMKQVVIVQFLLVFLLVFVRAKNKLVDLLFLLAGFLIPAVYMIFYIARIGVFSDFYRWAIIFNIQTYSELARKFPSYVEIIKLLPIYVPATLVLLYRIFKREYDRTVWLIAFFVSSLIFVYSRFDLVHLQPSLPYAILLIISASQLFKNDHFVKIVMAVFGVSVVILLASLNRSSGRVRYFGHVESQVVRRIKDYTSENDSIYVISGIPHLYFLTNTLPPGRYHVAHLPWYMIHVEDRVLASVIEDKPALVVRSREAYLDGRSVYDYLQNISEYIDNNYKLVERYNNIEILMRK